MSQHFCIIVFYHNMFVTETGFQGEAKECKGTFMAIHNMCVQKQGISVYLTSEVRPVLSSMTIYCLRGLVFIV